MLLSEFIERTGFDPTSEEYAEIEERYYNFDGNKDAFCNEFSKNHFSEMLKARKEKIEQLKSSILEQEKMFRAEVKKSTKEIKRLQEALDKELEWKPYENEHNVQQTDYERLAADSTTKELTDEEAIDIIANEFGFDRSKIVIVHEVAKMEINRHCKCRKIGMIPRKALFNVWDWNYIAFNIRGNTTMGYEMHDGELQMYWG